MRSFAGTLCQAVVCTYGVLLLHGCAPMVGEPVATGPAGGSEFRVRQQRNPARVEIRDEAGRWLATFTHGARTVAVAGPIRTFREPEHTSATVSHGVWVRLLPEPFAGMPNLPWLQHALRDSTADVLAIAMQYTANAPERWDDGGALRIAGDAGYGPLLRPGVRGEGADFNDYLGVPWQYEGGLDRPERKQAGSLDCSGFVRMVFGYRSGVPLTLEPNGVGIPRRSHAIFADAPGTVIVPNQGRRPRTLESLMPGDLVFFDADRRDGPALDHVGVYLGKDDAGKHRFLSSRKRANGPTLGDVGGKALLDGRGFYAGKLRAARRL